MKTNKLLLILFLLSLFLTVLTYSYLYVYKSGGEGCTPVGFSKELFEGEKYLVWNTADECTGYVRYGLKDTTFPYLAVDDRGMTKTREHKIKMGGVDSGVKYYVIIFSGDEIFGRMGLPIEVEFD